MNLTSLNSWYQKLQYCWHGFPSVPTYIPLESVNLITFSEMELSHLLGVIWKRSSHVIGLQRFIQTMRAIQGAFIVASSIQIIMGYSQVWGLFSRYIGSIWKCEVVSQPVLDYIFLHCCLGFPCRFFSPLSMAPVVALVGLGLFQRGFPLVGIAIL